MLKLIFVGMRHQYLFPTHFTAKGLLGCKIVQWGQGRDLTDQDAAMKNLANGTEHELTEDPRRFWDSWATAHLRQRLWRASHTRLTPFTDGALEDMKNDDNQNSMYQHQTCRSVW